MIRINRATEYGLMALVYMDSFDISTRKSAREIAEHLKLPFEVTAKTLQRLKETGFVESTQGTTGGYRLVGPLQDFNLAQLVEAVEGTQALVACQDSNKDDCELSGTCEIKNPIAKVNIKIKQLLSSIPLSEVLESKEIV